MKYQPKLLVPNYSPAIERLNIPPVRMSDGPNGVRGSSHFVSTPAQCLPCATSLAATFDPQLIEEVGHFLGEEAKLKSAVVLLAPTCNIQRSPLGGRAFESFSEDPHLSGACLLPHAYFVKYSSHINYRHTCIGICQWLAVRRV
jgi:beta-glucosidase-like glycosyl hydrolase